jgi:hypothetical protein
MEMENSVEEKEERGKGRLAEEGVGEGRGNRDRAWWGKQIESGRQNKRRGKKGGRTDEKRAEMAKTKRVHWEQPEMSFAAEKRGGRETLSRMRIGVRRRVGWAGKRRKHQ